MPTTKRSTTAATTAAAPAATPTAAPATIPPASTHGRAPRMLAMLAASLSVMAGPQRVFAATETAMAAPTPRTASGDPLAGTGPLVGAWALVSVDNRKPDGSHTQPYGLDPQGLLIFDARGRYSLQIFRAVRPRFAANDKGRGTAEEYHAAVMGSNSHFGTYAIDAGAAFVTFHLEHASYPNWDGIAQRRPFTVHDGELRYTVPATTDGDGTTGEVVWRRLE